MTYDDIDQLTIPSNPIPTCRTESTLQGALEGQKYRVLATTKNCRMGGPPPPYLRKILLAEIILRNIAGISHHRHGRRQRTFQQRTQNFGLFWPRLAIFRGLRSFGALFTGLNNVVAYQKGHIVDLKRKQCLRFRFLLSILLSLAINGPWVPVQPQQIKNSIEQGKRIKHFIYSMLRSYIQHLNVLKISELTIVIWAAAIIHNSSLIFIDDFCVQK